MTAMPGAPAPVSDETPTVESRRTAAPPAASSPAGRPARRVAVAVLPGLVAGVAMLAVALVGAARPVLSWDEVTSADVAGRTAGQIAHLLRNVDAVHGAYYFFLHAWTSVAGTAELALRLPSILAMAGAAAATAELARRLFGTPAGLAAGLILALLPNTSRYAAEARPYAFACLFAALAVLLLHLALERSSARRWVAYGLAVALLGLTHVLALATLAGHAALVLRRGRSGRVWAGTVAVALLPAIPVLLLGSRHQDTQLHWLKPLTTRVLHDGPADIVGAAETAWLLIGLALLAVLRPPPRPDRDAVSPALGSAPPSPAALGSAPPSPRALGSAPPSPVAALAVLVLAPPLLLALLSIVDSPVWVPRYLLVVLGPLAVLAAAVAGRSAARIGVVLLLLAATGYPAHQAVRAPNAKVGPDFRRLAAIIQQHQQPGDVLIYQAGSRFLRAGLDHYFAGERRPADVLWHRSGAELGMLAAAEHPVTAGRLAGAGRVWVVLSARRDPLDARPGLRPVLTRDFRRVGYWAPVRSRVALYLRSR